MENRMKNNQLPVAAQTILLEKTEIGALATINEDKTPYVIPVHFVYISEKIYIHGLPKGRKIFNIIKNPAVSFTVYKMTGYLLDEEEKPCDTNTAYHSVVIAGKGKVVTDIELKQAVLSAVVKKYTPHLADKPLPSNMVNGTGVIEIDIITQTGKFFA